jgi:hypothetical protein
MGRPSCMAMRTREGDFSPARAAATEGVTCSCVTVHRPVVAAISVYVLAWVHRSSTEIVASRSAAVGTQ